MQLSVVWIDQRDTNGLANENTELRLRLQSMEQQALLRNALNGEALRKEVERMKIETGEVSGFAVQSKPANGEVEFSERVRVSTERTVASGLEISSNNSSSIFKSEGPSLSSSAY
ncbi:unnamed protein product [Brassica napus]|uniref:(rape) hypothetical protein n=1 Tax=Brassica napus TaxID=3708 RepID=A0A817B2F2_BRANA|nr:unnamed protein product [Brassica napus]